MGENINLIESSRIVLMWENDRWDVPLSGILKLDGRKICYFKRVYHPADAEEGKISYDDKEYDRYDVFELSPEQIKFELKMHEDFVRYVGSHTEAVDNKLGVLGEKTHLIKPLGEHKKFYNKYTSMNQKEYENNKYLGSFYMKNGDIE